MTEPCPGCGQLDQVQRVPAAYEGDQSLDPFPPPRGGGGLRAAVAGLVLAGSALLLLPLAVSGGPGGEGAEALGIVAVSLPALGAYAAAGALIRVSVRRSRAHRRHQRGIPAARQVWEQGWFCHRCTGVFFADGGRLLTPAHFRQLVARAGGYAR